MLVGAKVCELTEDLLWFECGLYVGILTFSLISRRGAHVVTDLYRAILDADWPPSPCLQLGLLIGWIGGGRVAK